MSLNIVFHNIRLASEKVTRLCVPTFDKWTAGLSIREFSGLCMNSTLSTPPGGQTSDLMR